MKAARSWPAVAWWRFQAVSILGRRTAVRRAGGGAAPGAAGPVLLVSRRWRAPPAARWRAVRAPRVPVPPVIRMVPPGRGARAAGAGAGAGGGAGGGGGGGGGGRGRGG